MRPKRIISAGVIVSNALLSLAIAALLSACESANDAKSSEKEAQELAQLREENNEVKKLTVENRELDRLRRDNQELPKLRAQQDEIARVQKDNAQLRQQITNAQTANAAARAADLAAQAKVAGQPLQPGQIQIVQTVDPNIPQTNDELLVEPRFLKNILPNFDWEKLKRTEPIGIKAMLEQNGIVLTNYQQLVALGISNYIVKRPPENTQQPTK